LAKRKVFQENSVKLYDAHEAFASAFVTSIPEPTPREDYPRWKAGMPSSAITQEMSAERQAIKNRNSERDDILRSIRNDEEQHWFVQREKFLKNLIPNATTETMETYSKYGQRYFLETRFAIKEIECL
jgi:hypothetical protein